MKKIISLVLIVAMAISVFPTIGVAAVTETKIWHEDFEGANVLNSYNITSGDGSISIDSTNSAFDSNALKISSGASNTVFEKVNSTSWTFGTNENVVISFDFMVTNQNTSFFMFGSDDYAHENNSSQKKEYFCSSQYVAASNSYQLLRNAGSKETVADCYLGDVPLNQKNNITIVFIPRKSTYYAVSAIYINGTKCSGVVNWTMSGIPASTMAKMRFAARTSEGTGDVYMDNIKISHFTDKTLAYAGNDTLEEVNPYNPIVLGFDHHLSNCGSVTLAGADGEVEVDYSLNGKNIIVTPKSYLDLNSSYTLSVTDAQNLFANKVSKDITINTIKERCSIENKEVKNYNLDEVKILVDKDIAPDAVSDISFVCSDGAAPIGTAYTKTENGNIYLYIPVVDNLKCGREYTISLSSIAGFESFEDIIFTTKEGTNVSRPAITGLDSDCSLQSGTLTATVTTDSDIPTTALMLLYYKDNKLIGVSCKTISPDSNEITTSIAITETVDCYVKVCVVDGFENMKPISDVTTIGR